MANQNPNFPAVEPFNLHVDLDGVDPVVGNPTNEEIIREHDHFVQIEGARKRGAALDNDQFGTSIMRYHNVLNVRSAADLGSNNAAIALQLAAIQQQIAHGFQHVNDRFEQVNDRFEQVNNRIDQVNARMSVDRARNFNNSNCLTPSYHGSQFRRLVKYNPGHPTPQPPPGVTRLDLPHELVVFVQPQGGYPIGSIPPAGLVPQNFNELLAMSDLGINDLRRAIRGIYWFYNDPMLELTPRASLVDSRARLTDLRAFLTEI